MLRAVLREVLGLQFVRLLHVLDRVEQITGADGIVVEDHHHPSQDGVDLRPVNSVDAFEALLQAPGDELVARPVDAAHLDVGTAVAYPGTPGHPAAAGHGDGQLVQPVVEHRSADLVQGSEGEFLFGLDARGSDGPTPGRLARHVSISAVLPMPASPRNTSARLSPVRTSARRRSSVARSVPLSSSISGEPDSSSTSWATR